MISSSVIKQEVPDSAENYSADSSQSLELRRTKKELAKTNKEVQDLRAFFQSTSEAHDAKLNSLQAQFVQSTREVQDLRALLQSTSEANDAKFNCLQVQLDTIIRIVSGGPWMFNQPPQMFTQPPVLQNFPQQYISNQEAPLTLQPLGTDGLATSQQQQMFTHLPVPRNFPQEYIVNQETPPPEIDSSGFGASQPSPNMVPVLSKTPERPTIAVKAGQKSVEMCLFCKSKSHESQGCTQITSGLRRREFVKENNICERCLKPLGQNALHEPCTTEKCAVCNKNHNTIMCTMIENRYCGFCRSRDHSVKECPKYFIGVSVTDRKTMLEKEDRCLTCFKGNRVGNHERCRNQSLCHTCMKKYNDPEKAVHHSFSVLRTRNRGFSTKRIVIIHIQNHKLPLFFFRLLTLFYFFSPHFCVFTSYVILKHTRLCFSRERGKTRENFK